MVLEGTVVLRTPQGEEELRRGALVCFGPGPAGAHKIGNRGEQPAIAMRWSSSREPAVAVYPDSDKIGVWPGGDIDDLKTGRWCGRLLAGRALSAGPVAC